MGSSFDIRHENHNGAALLMPACPEFKNKSPSATEGRRYSYMKNALMEEPAFASHASECDLSGFVQSALLTSVAECDSSRR